MTATAREGTAGVCVFSERTDVGLELLTIGRRLADELHGTLTAVVLESAGSAAIDDHLCRGADEVLIATAAVAGATPISQDGDTCVEVLASAVARLDPEVVLVGGTALGTEASARLAQRLRLGCATDCLELRCDPQGLLVERRCFGRFMARHVLLTRPAVATIPPRRFEAAAPTAARRGRRSRIAVTAPPPRIRRLALEARESPPREIESADVVVAVGRGLREASDLHLAEELAAGLGGVLAATRPLTDHLGWLPADVKVGLSGRTVAPELYVACGISGQIEHVVGMRGARIVVAINNDPQAPIFDEADYRIVGDLYEILPALTAGLGACPGNETAPLPNTAACGNAKQHSRS